MCAKIFYFELERVLVSATCSLESHMFQEVRCSIRFVCLCARACVYPDTDSGGLCMWMGLCCDSKTVWECGCLGDGCRDVHGRRERPQGALGVSGFEVGNETGKLTGWRAALRRARPSDTDNVRETIRKKGRVSLPPPKSRVFSVVRILPVFPLRPDYVLNTATQAVAHWRRCRSSVC